MSIALICLCASIIAILLANLCVSRKKLSRKTRLLMLIGISLPFFCLSELNAVQGVLLIIVGVMWGAIGRESRSYLWGSLIATIVAYVYVLPPGLAKFRQFEQLRKDYPYESLVGRLEPINNATRIGGAETYLTNSTAFTDAENWFERENLDKSIRQRDLRLIHAMNFDHFITTPSTGWRRMILPHRSHIELRPVTAPISLPVDIEFSFGTTSSDSMPADFRVLHEKGIHEFLDPTWFGSMQSVAAIAGFQSHQFRDTPLARTKNSSGEHWQIKRLDLVSLLKFEEPAVYESEHLPRMDELRDVPTRPLNGFEKKALASLRLGDDLQIQAEGEHYRMFGSIRAVNTCRACHTCQRGDLLGAFSYELRRSP